MKNAALATVTHEDISARARQLWENAGRPVGRDDEFWLQAERELRLGAETNGRPKTTRRSASAPGV
jgi:hypothetical protein